MKKIAILGSTGSIGKNTISIIKKNKNEFNVKLLTTNTNINELFRQLKSITVENIIITSEPHYQIAVRKLKNKKINIFNNFKNINKIFKSRIDYTMSAISGLDGLEPTLNMIKHTKLIAIANKEAIICGWNLIENLLKKYQTDFVPVDSEHFSIWSLLNEKVSADVEYIYITASGGPFLKYPKSELKKISPKSALNHPNWKMGKKISIDSATMMNKVFEVIEAQRIFKIELKKFKILIHPKSYMHSMIKFKNGTIKLLIHDTNMKIPIFNSIYKNKKIKTRKLNFEILNNLSLSQPKFKQFPNLKIIKKLKNTISLYETVIISSNDELVRQFLNGKISFLDINKFLKIIMNKYEFKKLLKIKPKNIKQIKDLDAYVRLKTLNLCIK